MKAQDSMENFLKAKRIAIVGVSRNPEHISRDVYSAFLEDGYDVVPVNPNIDELDGAKVFHSLQDVEPAVDAAYLIVPPKSVLEVVSDANEANINLVWFHYDGTKEGVPKEAVKKALSYQMRVVPGACILHHTNRRNSDVYKELSLEEFED